MQKKYEARKDQDNKTSSPKKILPKQQDEYVNTDGHRSSSSRDVGPGYDDTGLGNDAKSSLKDESGDPNRNKQNQKNQKKLVWQRWRIRGRINQCKGAQAGNLHTITGTFRIKRFF